MFIVKIDENMQATVACCDREDREAEAIAKGALNGWLFESKTKGEVLEEYGTEQNMQATAPEVWDLYTRATDEDRIMRYLLGGQDQKFLSSDEEAEALTFENWASNVLRDGNKFYDEYHVKDHALVQYRSLPDTHKEDPTISAIWESVENHAG